MTTTNTKVTKRTNGKATASVHAEISRDALANISIAGGVIGLWSFACFASALFYTGGPISLAKTWFGAVAGL